jgi:hypothetical protein
VDAEPAIDPMLLKLVQPASPSITLEIGLLTSTAVPSASITADASDVVNGVSLSLPDVVNGVSSSLSSSPDVVNEVLAPAIALADGCTHPAVQPTLRKSNIHIIFIN